MRNSKSSLLTWLGFHQVANFNKSKLLGGFFGTLIVLFCFIFLLSVFLSLKDFIWAALKMSPYNTSYDGSALRNTGLVVVALLGAPFLIWRTVIAAKQNEIAEETLNNEKVNAAAKDLAAQYERTEQIGSGPNKNYVNLIESDLVTRTGAIDRLEGLAMEQPELAPRLVRILASYVRGTFPANDLDISEEWSRRAVPRMDLQKSIDSIGMLLKVAREVDPTNWRLDLRGCNFDGVDFSKGHFFAVNFSQSRFEGSIAEDTNFEGANLSGCLLNHCWFRGANLMGANFDYCVLNRPKPDRRGMDFTISLAKDIRGLTLISADITAINYLGEPEKIRQTFGTLETQVSDEVSEMMPSLEDWRLATNREKSNSTIVEKAFKKVEKTGFDSWSPYKSNDFATGPLRMRLMKRLDLTGWPYS